jgi:hypothetical protein
MREITRPVPLCLPGGRLNPEAAGFTRHPLHTSDGMPSGPLHLWRARRWDRWGITTERFVLGMTVAHLDSAAVLQAYFYDRLTGKEIVLDQRKAFPPAGTVRLPDGLPPLSVGGRLEPLRLRFADQPDGRVVLWLESPRLQAVLEVAPGGESLGVVVPWSAKRYQYTLKDVGRPVSGILQVDGEELDVEGPDAVATLDRGRGRGPHSRRWEWAVGTGTLPDGQRLGLQLGGAWTEGTGATENALFLGGRVHHHDGDLTFSHDPADPKGAWTVSGDWIEARLDPFHLRRAATGGLLVSGTAHQAFGRWSGWAAAPDGTRLDLAGLTGWAEEATNRW